MKQTLMLNRRNSYRAMLTRWSVLGICVLMPTLTWAQSGSTSAAEEATLITTLQSDTASLFDKAKACQRLAVVGTAKAVPVLASLLADEKLAHYARFGLEPIPDPSVDTALRTAMGKLEGKLRVGVINSIGARQDSCARYPLALLLGGPDAEIAAAAAGALGRMGTPRAAELLTEALNTASGDLRVAVADACLPCAETLLARGRPEDAARLYDVVRRTDVPKHIQIAALRGAILARGEGGVELLVEAIKAGDAPTFELGLMVAREMPRSGVTRALVALLATLSPQKQALVIKALGDRGDSAALPAVVAAAKSGAEEVRVAALEVLERLGDASALPMLLEAASSAEAEVAQAARATLASLEGTEVDDAIVRMLRRGDGRFRSVLIELVGERRIQAGIDALRKAATEEDAGIRRAAIAALGKTIELDDFDVLTERVTAPKVPGDASAALEALKTACQRMTDRDACAEKLGAAMEGASATAKAQLLDVFIAVGGAKALATVAACARDRDETMRATAVRVLGDWAHEDAAQTLLDLTRASDEARERLRTMQAFRDLIRRLGFQKEKRIGFCEKAMEIAKGEAEQKLVLEALSGIPAPETLSLLMTYLAEPSLKEGACEAAVIISERLVRSRRGAVTNAMKKVLEVTKNKDLAARARAVLSQATGGT